MNRPADGDGLPPALADRIGYLLGQAHLAHRSLAAASLAALGLGVKEYGALSVLAAEGPLSQQRLGERLRIDRTTMVAVVDALGRAGFVERRRDPKDRRAYALQTTPRGRRVLDQADAAARRAEAEFLAPIAAADRRKLKELLRRVIAP